MPRKTGVARRESHANLSRRIMALAKHYQMRSRDRICRHGITVSQCYALEAIVERNGMPVTELARDLSLDKSTTSRLAESLIARRFATVEATHADARVKKLVPTRTGRALALRIKREIRAEHQAVLAEFTLAELDACERVLGALLASQACRPDIENGLSAA